MKDDSRLIYLSHLISLSLGLGSSLGNILLLGVLCIKGGNIQNSEHRNKKQFALFETAHPSRNSCARITQDLYRRSYIISIYSIQ